MPTLDTADFIAKYGAQAALINDPVYGAEIRRLLEQAIAQGWTKDLFQAQFMNTTYFQKHGSAWRKAGVAKASDPGEYAASKNKIVNDLRTRAIALGYGVDEAALVNLAGSLLDEYYGEGVPNNVMDSRLEGLAKASKIVGGRSMSFKDNLLSYAASMGVKFDPGYFDSAAKSIAAGTSTIEQWNDAIKQAAKSRFPMFATQIDAGVTVDQIASPYKQAVSNVLEIPFASITLDDPVLGQAFGGTNKDGQPSVMGLWDFEKSLRNDPRWVYTKNARTAIDSTARKVLQDFGLAY